MVGYRYEYVMYGTKQKLIDCYNVFSSLSTSDGVPNGIETAFTITPSMYISNVKNVLKTTKSIITKSIITKRRASATPTTNQNKAMVDLLEALVFILNYLKNLAPYQP